MFETEKRNHQMKSKKRGSYVLSRARINTGEFALLTVRNMEMPVHLQNLFATALIFIFPFILKLFSMHSIQHLSPCRDWIARDSGKDWRWNFIPFIHQKMAGNTGMNWNAHDKAWISNHYARLLLHYPPLSSPPRPAGPYFSPSHPRRRQEGWKWPSSQRFIGRNW